MKRWFYQSISNKITVALLGLAVRTQLLSQYPAPIPTSATADDTVSLNRRREIYGLEVKCLQDPLSRDILSCATIITIATCRCAA